jgi:hypothetical protein
MSTELRLREKLRKIEALFARAGTAGEQSAAEAALEAAPILTRPPTVFGLLGDLLLLRYGHAFNQISNLDCRLLKGRKAKPRFETHSFSTPR